MSRLNRIKRLEHQLGINAIAIQEITINFVDMDKSVSSTMKIKVDHANHKRKLQKKRLRVQF